jgi:hypothetical protein
MHPPEAASVIEPVEWSLDPTEVRQALRSVPFRRWTAEAAAARQTSHDELIPVTYQTRFGLIIEDFGDKIVVPGPLASADLQAGAAAVMARMAIIRGWRRCAITGTDPEIGHRCYLHLSRVGLTADGAQQSARRVPPVIDWWSSAAFPFWRQAIQGRDLKTKIMALSAIIPADQFDHDRAASFREMTAQKPPARTPSPAAAHPAPPTSKGLAALRQKANAEPEPGPDLPQP